MSKIYVNFSSADRIIFAAMVTSHADLIFLKNKIASISNHIKIVIPPNFTFHQAAWTLYPMIINYPMTRTTSRTLFQVYINDKG